MLTTYPFETTRWVKRYFTLVFPQRYLWPHCINVLFHPYALAILPWGIYEYYPHNTHPIFNQHYLVIQDWYYKPTVDPTRVTDTGLYLQIHNTLELIEIATHLEYKKCSSDFTLYRRKKFLEEEIIEDWFGDIPPVVYYGGIAFVIWFLMNSGGG
jgi:hypothetical protein